MPHKVILDVDTGTDDAVALMFAALHPDIELVAATTVHGNVPVENCTENTLRTFDYVGVSVPVYQGMSSPLTRADYPIPRSQRGPSRVHGEYLDIPPSKSKAQSQHAVDFLIEYYMSGQGDDTVLIPVGSMTNVAMAIRQEPRIVEHIPEIVIMGGGHEVGNVTPSAEANIWRDPEGARVLFHTGVKKITLVPLDATHRALVSLDDCRKLRALGTPAAEAAAIFTERRIEAYDAVQPMSRKGAAPVHDALCTAYIVDPSVLKDVHHCFVDVETFGELTVGRTVCDIQNRTGKDPNCYVALDADEPKFVKLLMETLGRKAG
mgnify:CR=1 FL=1